MIEGEYVEADPYVEKDSTIDLSINLPPAEIRKDQKLVYATFINKFGTPNRVFYPGCGPDATPAFAFPDSEVVFLDPAEGSIKSVKRQIKEAITILSDSETFKSGEKFDLVIDNHAHGEFKHHIKDLKVGGHVLMANKNADFAFESDDLKLVGVMDFDSN